MAAIRGEVDFDLEALRHELLSTTEVRRQGDDPRRLRRLAGAGRLVRVRRGHYVRTETWDRLGGRDQHLLRVLAADRDSVGTLVLCRESAAALWDVPLLGPWPEEVWAMTDGRPTLGARGVGDAGFRRMASGEDGQASIPGGRSESGMRRTRRSADSVIPTRRHGLLVTDVARTALDLARDRSFAAAMTFVDWARWRNNAAAVSLIDLRRELSRMNPRTGRTHLARCIDFSTDLAHPPAESALRATIHELGFSPPVPQLELTDGEGRMFADLAWPEYRVLLEFDGAVKYSDPRYTGGDPLARFREEKHRERRLVLLGWKVVRVEWADVVDRRRLERILRRAGVPQVAFP